ncbi:hypothetical protein XaCFBP7622_10480 [Xanthomonas arboricola]|nr:hypothetical protein XaCFBP7622_10480 [Xanthomonas arboricola]
MGLIAGATMRRCVDPRLVFAAMPINMAGSDVLPLNTDIQRCQRWRCRCHQPAPLPDQAAMLAGATADVAGRPAQRAARSNASSVMALVSTVGSTAGGAPGP